MRTITAAVDPAAISKVSRLFDASDRQIIDEMLQNARRAGATRVDVEIADGQVTITDDGRGIADPQTLLAFGKSGWNQGVCSSEDPAGMGFFSLARRNAAVDSRPAGGDAWRVDLEPEHFTGRKPAQVRAGADAPAPHGTRVTFSRRRHERDIAGEIANAAIHCPVAVTVGGKSVEHEDFLQHAVRVSEYEGVRIGVFHGTDKRDPKARSFPNTGRINFHGVAVACPELPKVVPVSERGGRIAKAWRTAVDVKDCPQLELVLPTRHKAVDNEFLHTLAGACRRAIYHAIVEDGRDIRLARVDQLEALVDEIPMPEPPAELKPWEPARREDEYTGANWSAAGTRSVYGPGDSTPLVMDACPEYATAQVAGRALERAGMLGRVFVPISAYSGYRWYEELDRITGISVTATRDGGTERLLGDEPDGADDHAGEVVRAERITVTLHVANRCSGAKRDIELQTDVSFTGDDPDHHDQIGIVLTTDAEVGAEELAELMMNAFFSPSLDAEGDSFKSQKEFHEAEYARIATEATASAAEAREQYLETLAWSGILPPLRPGESITIERDAANRTEIRVTLPDAGETG